MVVSGDLMYTIKFTLFLKMKYNFIIDRHKKAMRNSDIKHKSLGKNPVKLDCIISVQKESVEKRTRKYVKH